MLLLESATTAALGSLLGMRHALEPDHLAAVSTLVTGERSSLKAVWLGACWGMGHTLTLVVAGSVLVLLRAEMPAAAADAFEFVVALMLIALGLRALYRAARQGADGPTHRHHHGPVVHVHPGVQAHVHIGRWTLARRPLLIGAVHGLAGSGALTALVLATLPSTGARLAYMALFGLGSTVGMASLSGVLGWPLGRLAKHPAIGRGITAAVGCISTGLGVWWGYPLIGRLF
jgi:ABC-type nickel/cobalt efflux system permease component RcnA